MSKRGFELEIKSYSLEYLNAMEDQLRKRIKWMETRKRTRLELDVRMRTLTEPAVNRNTNAEFDCIMHQNFSLYLFLDGRNPSLEQLEQDEEKFDWNYGNSEYTYAHTKAYVGVEHVPISPETEEGIVFSVKEKCFFAFFKNDERTIVTKLPEDIPKSYTRTLTLLRPKAILSFFELLFDVLGTQ